MPIFSVFPLIYICHCEFQIGPSMESFCIWTIVELQDVQILLLDIIMANVNPV